MISGTTALIIVVIAAALLGLVFVIRARRRSAAASKTSSSQSNSSSPLRSAITTGDTTHTQVASPSETPAPAQVEPEAQSEPEVEEAEPTAAELIAEGDTHAREFNYDDAIESYESAQDAVVEEHGRDSLEFADLLIKTEDAYFARDNQDDTDDLNCNNYLRALSILERRLGAFDVRLLPVLNRIVAFYLLVDKVSEAETIVRRQQLIESREKSRLAQIERAAAPAAPSASTVPAEPAASGETKVEPAAVHSEAQQFLVVALDSGNADVDKLANQGDSARAEYEYDAAVDHYNEALEAAQQAFGRDSVALVPVLMRLADAFHARDVMETDSDGDSYTDPLDQSRLALALLVKERGILDPRLVPVLTNMVAFSDLIGDHYKAGSYMNMIDNINQAASRTNLR